MKRGINIFISFSPSPSFPISPFVFFFLTIPGFLIIMFTREIIYLIM